MLQQHSSRTELQLRNSVLLILKTILLAKQHSIADYLAFIIPYNTLLFHA